MKIVLTGGAGFIGTHLAEKLCHEHQVVIFDNLHRDSFSGTWVSRHPNVEFYEGDVLGMLELSRVMRGADAVIHLAAIAGVGMVVNNPALTMRVNLLGTYNALEAARQRGVKRFIDFSTSEVFGSMAYRVNDTDISPSLKLGDPRWTYAVAKLAGEFFGHAYYDEYGMEVVTVRPFNVYGPRQFGESAPHHFIEAALAGDPLIIYGHGSQIRSWCYIDDFVDGVLRAFKYGKPGHAYNIGNPDEATTITELAKRVISLSGSDSLIYHVPQTYTDVEIRIPDISGAIWLGYSPRVGLDEGLTKTIESYRV